MAGLVDGRRRNCRVVRLPDSEAEVDARQLRQIQDADELRRLCVDALEDPTNAKTLKELQGEAAAYLLVQAAVGIERLQLDMDSGTSIYSKETSEISLDRGLGGFD